ncbi:MAG TPA: ABC transporter permease [Nocardioides sp.]|uniref:ABC transporter permease n=1 Tax=uncultured Nocardioides sp. TaxID=198441 RepID=UPI00261E8E06|nr:ABC transporter permease [uncultured Nocardioides sp.]HRD59907.1 ABC transporter permease [Nocardioides sp.]HRI94677.1 ABC transporter permease [Nocardioides sp.]HRK44440.1 ABC transporter permease [Nocardioides sp.]
MTTGTLPAEAGTTVPAVAARRPGLLAALRFETLKLRAQLRAKCLLIGAILVPIAVVVVVHSQPRPPKDTLFGRFATENGFAMALLVLGFATQWVLPLLTAIVAGDMFASEDQHGTWKTVLTRSTSRSTMFWAKTAVAIAFALVALTLLAASTIASSWLIVGHQPLTGLSGQTIAARSALELVSASWAVMALPIVGFTCLALLFSVWSRSAAVGIAAPVVLGLVMQLVGALGGIETLRPFLLSTPFEAWHGLLAAPRFTGPLLDAVVTSAGWSVVCLTAAFLILRRRDITGG